LIMKLSAIRSDTKKRDMQCALGQSTNIEQHHHDRLYNILITKRNMRVVPVHCVMLAT
jgi:hypothetical protein